MSMIHTFKRSFLNRSFARAFSIGTKDGQYFQDLKSGKVSPCSHEDKKKQDIAVAEFAAKLAEEFPDPREKDYANMHESLKGTAPNLEDALQANKAFMKLHPEKEPGYFERFGASQAPRYLYLGCSDSRVDPALAFRMPNTELFVHRNIGNIMDPRDLSLLAVIEYSVSVLKVPHIIVCGHYDCGAVRGADSKRTWAQIEQEGNVYNDLGVVESWINPIRETISRNYETLKSIKDPEERHRKIVDLHVIKQCRNVFKIPTIQKRRMESQKRNDPFLLPRIHGLVYDTKNGQMKQMDLSFLDSPEETKRMSDVYELFSEA